METALTLILVLTFFAAGLVKGVTGMGLPTVAMGILGSVLSPIAAAGLLVIPSFVTNVWQMAAGPNLGRSFRRSWPMMLTITVGTVAAIPLMIHADARLISALLGAVLLAYAVFTLFARPMTVPPGAERFASPAIGAITGAVTGATGVFVIPAVPYLQSLGLAKDDLVQALGLSFTVSTVALAVALASQQAFEAGGLLASSLLVLPALFGMWVGQRIRGRISQRTFRRWFLILLAILGAQMMGKAVLAGS